MSSIEHLTVDDILDPDGAIGARLRPEHVQAVGIDRRVSPWAVLMVIAKATRTGSCLRSGSKSPAA